MAGITDEKYVSLTTFKKDGTPRPTPVWIADFGDGTMGFTTSPDSYKVKRLRNDPRVTLQPSDARGNVKEGTEPVTGTATVVTGEGFKSYQQKVQEKYGFQYRAMMAMAKIQTKLGRPRESSAAVVITLD